MKSRFVVASVLFWLSFVLPASAQNASLTGIVKDPQGAIIPGASATLTNSQTRVAQTTAAGPEAVTAGSGLSQLRFRGSAFNTAVFRRRSVPETTRTSVPKIARL